MIVKLQRALYSTVRNPPVMVYSQGRAFETELPLTKDLTALFGPRYKIYCEAHIEGCNLVIDSVVADRSW